MLTPGTYASATVTVDQRGRILAVTGDLIATDVPTGHRSLAPGTYTNATITIDQGGRLVSIANGATATDQVPQRQRTLTRGTYTTPTITVDRSGRIVSIANGEETAVAPPTLASDFSDISFNGNVNDMVLRGTTLYLVGEFTSVTDSSGTYGRGYGAALDITTALFTNWDPVLNARGDTLYDSGSAFYIGGAFTDVAGTTRKGVVKLTGYTDAVDAGFNPGDCNDNGSKTVYAMVAAGGYLYFGGNFNNVAGSARAKLARVALSDGTLDSWDAAQNGDNCFRLRAVGSTVYAAGTWSNILSTSRNLYAAWDATAGTITSWNPGSNSAVDSGAPHGMRVTEDGSSMFLGSGSIFGNYGAKSNLTNGNLTGWLADAQGIICDFSEINDKVWIVGSFGTIDGAAHLRGGIVDAATGEDEAFDPDFTGGSFGGPRDMCIQSSDAFECVFVGGKFTGASGETRNHFAVFEATGILL